MSTCVLCIDVYSSGVHAGASGQHFEIFSKDGLLQQMSKIIRKHFWIQLDKQKDAEAVLCDKCWETLKEFHTFYEKIVKVHAVLRNINIDTRADPLPTDELQLLKNEVIDINVETDKLQLVKNEDHETNIDPLPSVEVDLKNENPEVNLVLDEVKVEVDDLELLPQAEVIEAAVIEDVQIDDDFRRYATTPTNDSDDDTAESEPKPAKRARGRPRKDHTTDKPVINVGSKRCTRNSLKENEADNREVELSWRKKRIRNPNPIRMTAEEKAQKLAKQKAFDEVIMKMFPKLKCDVCNRYFSSFETLRVHFRENHDDQSFHILCCGRKFKTRRVLADHVCLHFNPEHFKCTVCESIFQDSHALEVHEQAHRNSTNSAVSVVKEKKVFQCDKCPRYFTTKAALQYHVFSKHVPSSEFKFSCKECHKKLPTERKLKSHMKYIHDPESTFICDKCGKRMQSHSSLKKHHLTEHSDVPKPTPDPVQCELCGTWYRQLSGLKQHIRTIHQDTGGEHRCHICNKTSINARALKRHIYHNHLCERKFKCTMCEKAFKRPQDLREHTSTHTGEVLYTCPNCPMTFFSNANMYKHRQRLHPVEYQADRKKPLPPNIRRQAMCATAARKKQQALIENAATLLVQTQEN